MTKLYILLNLYHNASGIIIYYYFIIIIYTFIRLDDEQVMEDYDKGTQVLMTEVVIHLLTN